MAGLTLASALVTEGVSWYLVYSKEEYKKAVKDYTEQ